MKRTPINRGSGGLSRSAPMKRSSGLAARSAKMAAKYAGPEGRRVLVERLKGALAADLPAEGLEAVLALHPAVAELYENLHYAHAGLCRSPLGLAVPAETAARDVLARLKSRLS